MTAPTSFFLVHIDADLAGAPLASESIALIPGLHLVATTQTRSQLYHRLKRRFAPGQLLVAPLAEAPKFKGMAPGALRWLRDREGRPG